MVESQNKTLIFVETKRKADELQRRMQRDGLVLMHQNVADVSANLHILVLMEIGYPPTTMDSSL